MIKQWTIEQAEEAIKKLGDVVGEKIIVPDDIHDHKGTPEYEDFWDANTFLREEGYGSSMDDVLIEF